MELAVYIAGQSNVQSSSFVFDAYKAHFGMEPQKKDWKIGKYGKPFFAWPYAPCFSVSHSGDYICCAFADSEIGIDLQIIRALPSRLKRRFPFLNAKTEEEQTRRWTVFESYYKRLGTGLSIDTLPEKIHGYFIHSENLPGYILTVSLKAHIYDTIKLIWLEYADVVDAEI